MPDGVNFIAADIRPVAEAVSALRAETAGMDRKFLSRLQRRLTKAKFQLRSLRDAQTQNYVETGGGPLIQYASLGKRRLFLKSSSGPRKSFVRKSMFSRKNLRDRRMRMQQS